MFKVFVSTNQNPYINQAIESQLFYECQDMVLMIYRNDPCIVIGRNQNPWKEVKSLEIPILRRLSGGGTVYHDPDNINFAFIYNEGQSHVDKNFDYIISKVKLLGIDLHVTKRKDLFYKHFKVSGNAFYRRGKRRLHHGTLLVNVNTEDLWKVLNFDHDAFVCRSVPSVRSDIINMKQIKPDLTSDQVINVLSQGLDPYQIKVDYQNYFDKYQSRQWIYEETPDFDYKIDCYTIHVSGGRMTSEMVNINNKMFNRKLIKEEVENVSRIV